MHETSKKQYQPVERFRWALSFAGVSPAARLVLAALADHADQRKLTCFPAVETLARETRLSRRTVQTALRQLEVAGAILTERSRGRTSSLYRLMIPPNRAIPAPNRAIPARFNRAIPAPQQGYSFEQGKEQQQQQPLRVREASDLATTTPAAAALPCSSTSPSKTQTARHTCPKCERTWPKEHGPVCYACQFDVERAQRQQELLAKTLEDDRLFEEAHPPAPPPPPPPPPPPISQTAKRISHATRTALPESWLHHQDLKQLIDGQDFKEVCETIEGMSRLPPPESFFKDYSQYRQKYNMVEAEIKAGIEAMTDPKRWRVEKSQAA